MLNRRIKAALVVLAASAGLSACASYGPYGGSGVGVSVGYGSPYGYGYGSPYGYGYGSPYGYGYGSPFYAGYPYFGWHNGFYYPGAGYWLYDPWGRPSPITEDQANFWANMREKFRQARGANAEVKANFSGFRAQAKPGATITGVDLIAHERLARQLETRRGAQVERQQQMHAAREQARSDRASARSESPSSMREIMQERREQRRARRSGGGE